MMHKIGAYLPGCGYCKQNPISLLVDQRVPFGGHSMHTHTRTFPYEFSLQQPVQPGMYKILLHTCDKCVPSADEKSYGAACNFFAGMGWVGVPVAPSSHPAVSASSMLGLVRTADHNHSEGCKRESRGIQTPPALGRKGQITSFGATQRTCTWV